MVDCVISSSTRVALEFCTPMVRGLHGVLAGVQRGNLEVEGRGVQTVRRSDRAGGGPFGVAVQQGQLPLYLDLVADVGMTRIEAGEGFTTCRCRPSG
jgi:hypothetical protein